MDNPVDKKPLWKNKWLWIGVVVVLIVIGRAGNGGSSGASGSAGESAEVRKPDVAVTARKLWAEYDENEVAADGKYKGKTIEVTGEILEIRKTLGSAYVDLDVGLPIVSVSCEMRDEKSLAQLRKGAAITIIGNGAGKVINPQLDDCTIK